MDAASLEEQHLQTGLEPGKWSPEKESQGFAGTSGCWRNGGSILICSMESYGKELGEEDVPSCRSCGLQWSPT